MAKVDAVVYSFSTTSDKLQKKLDALGADAKINRSATIEEILLKFFKMD